MCLSVCFCVLTITTLNVQMLRASLSESLVIGLTVDIGPNIRILWSPNYAITLGR